MEYIFRPSKRCWALEVNEKFLDEAEAKLGKADIYGMDFTEGMLFGLWFFGIQRKGWVYV